MSSEPNSKDSTTGSIAEEETAPSTMTKQVTAGETPSTDGEIVEGDDAPTKKTYKQLAIENGMSYTVTDVPPLSTSLLLGLQHYLTMLGATVLIPLIVTPAMGASGSETAQVVSSIFFVSGINTVSNETHLEKKRKDFFGEIIQAANFIRCCCRPRRHVPFC
jgi:hypothetical protein